MTTKYMERDSEKIQVSSSKQDVALETIPTEESENSSSSIWNFIQRLSKKLDSLGVETRGIERIEPYERSTNKVKQLISVIGLWLSACGGLSSMSTFLLGPLIFELGLKKSLVSSLVGQAIGCGIAAYCSLMGPRSGCRQMVSARFLFGWWFVKLVSLVSIIGVMGWSVVNSVVGGQILQSVSDGKIPLVVGIIIVAIISLSVAIGGIKHLLRVETFLSIPVNVAFLLLYVAASQKFHLLSNLDGEEIRGMSDAVKGNWLSFFSLAYSTTATWGSIASDYYILFPENTPDVQIYFLTFFGILLPTSLVGVLGLLIGNVALSYKPWGDVYEVYGMGGLLNEAFKPWGAGGKFLLMVIFLSLVSNNIINTYSAAFGVQLAGIGFSKVPRWIWAIVLTAIYLLCALVGRNKLATVLGNFLPMVGYWISMYFVMLLEENLIFRSKRFIHLYTKEFADDDSQQSLTSGASLITSKETRHDQYYNFKIWNDYEKLSRGLASTAAFIIGAAGAAIGMAQVYWVGPLARLSGGEFGGDIAMWLCMGLSGIFFPWLRYWELKKFGR
ncbi:DEHA2C03564p [Debaryomyces hansenii CBS767]|uniref:DEHA2C03564p n=1 Tax=Debaryomyces hansenii (strain ATCC 36239 / CBS 767 / BCRC 21394 / JCM 1990 / NBRC 0083 / IGC 2968) TaxID=284592 RepID=Q6BVD3_DEBHA|nr:DEHA2C03564p [Debaryomyces hansenii CBS767]CAG85881.2 DEHA2C03564p [Debaryomyces hansenii CBS767]|eukprot:XP_457836.2 DEHA2C03564p [Debaryomyces hansenii CBS767]